MRYSILIAAIAAAFFVFGCEAGGAGDDPQQYTEADATTPEADATTPEADATTPEAELTEVDCLRYTEAFSGTYTIDVDGYEWTFFLPDFTFDDGKCVCDTGNQPEITDTVVSVANMLIVDNTIMACGPTPESEATCFLEEPDGSITLWGDDVGMTLNVQR